MRDPVVVLAGGKGSRMGGPKGLVKVGDVPLLLWQWQRLEAAQVRTAILVFGVHYECYLPFLESLERSKVKPIVVRNPNPDLGPFSSLQVGLHRCSQNAFVLPIDVMCPSAQVWSSFEAVQKDFEAVIPYWNHRGGHPVWLSQNLIQRIKQSPADGRLDVILRSLPSSAKYRLEVSEKSVVSNWNDPQSMLS